jgi:hypothetical protein
VDCGLGMWQAQTLLAQLIENGGTITRKLVRQPGYVQVWAIPATSSSYAASPESRGKD